MRSHRLVAAILLIVCAAPISAQSLDARTEYQLVQGPGHDGLDGPLLAIVLWRGDSGWMQPTSPAAWAHVDSVFRAESRRAQDTNRSFSGSGSAFFITDPREHTLTVEGKDFPLAAGDSALVVMVSVPPNGGPRTVAVTRISSTLPPELQTKFWQDGDTTFIVRRKFERFRTPFLAFLRSSPSVAAFLR